MERLNIGDKVRYICTNEEAVNSARLGQSAEVIALDDENDLLVRWKDGTIGGKVTNFIRVTSFQLIESESFEDKYMVYATDCENKSKLFDNEEALKKATINAVNDSYWTGRVIGYKLIPLFEGVKETKLKIFKSAKLKEVKRGRGRPRKV